MNTSPLISIIVPAYNAEETIGRCIESLLDQDYPRDRYEIIVVDNNSTDQTKKVIQRYPVRYILEDKKQGPAAARNAGARIAEGEGLMFFDADQFADKNYLTNIVCGWEEAQYGAFSGRNVGLNTRKDALGTYWAKEWEVTSDTKKDNFLPIFSGGLMLIRKDVFEKLEGFDTTFDVPTVEDIDLSWRMQKQLKLSIKYNFEAFAYHKEKVNLKVMLKREFVFGYGDTILGQKHPEAKKSLWKRFGIAIKRTGMGLLAFLFGLVTFWTKKRDKVHFQLILLDIVMHWANWWGRVVCTTKKMKWT